MCFAAAALEDVAAGAPDDVAEPEPLDEMFDGAMLLPAVASAVGCDIVVAVSPVAFVHEKFAAGAFELSVRSAHCPTNRQHFALGMRGQRRHLEELAVAAVVGELERDVRAVLHARETRRGEVDGEAEEALARHLEERHGLAEVGEVLRVRERRELDAHCGKSIA